MSADHGQFNGETAEGDDPPYFTITLYTWLTEEVAAVDLARRVAEIVGSIPEIDELATTVGHEEDPAAEPLRVYLDLAK